MLAKKYRLKAEFFKEKKRPIASFSSALFNAKIFASPLTFSRFAAVAPVSVFKKSVTRNKARRRFYEGARISKLNMLRGKDVVSYLKKEMADASPSKTAKEFENFLELLKEKK